MCLTDIISNLADVMLQIFSVLDLGVDYVDLILLHGASHRGEGKCDAAACTKDLGQCKSMVIHVNRWSSTKNVN